MIARLRIFKKILSYLLALFLVFVNISVISADDLNATGLEYSQQDKKDETQQNARSPGYKAQISKKLNTRKFSDNKVNHNYKGKLDLLGQSLICKVKLLESHAQPSHTDPKGGRKAYHNYYEKSNEKLTLKNLLKEENNTLSKLKNQDSNYKNQTDSEPERNNGEENLDNLEINSLKQLLNLRSTGQEDGEPGFGENRVIVKVNLHGLVGKEFRFDYIFPKGAKIDFVVMNPTTYDETIKTIDFTDNKTTLDFGIFGRVAIDDNGYVNLNEETEDALDNIDVRIIENVTSRQGGPTGRSVYDYDIYEVQNTNAIFKTVDQSGNLLTNPNVKVSYKLGSKSKDNLSIPNDSSKQIDMMDGERFLSHEWQGNFDGTNKPYVSLYKSQNGFIVDGDYAYKILKQEQKDNDKSNPLEVTLVRKNKVIKGGDHPKIINPDTGKEVDDSDYVKVEFVASDNSSIKGENPVYWVLKDLDLKERIKAPDVSVDDGYGFEKWEPSFSSTNQKYSKDTTHKAVINKINYIDYTTYAGDETTEKLQLDGLKQINYVGFVDSYGVTDKDKMKSVINFGSDPKNASLTLKEGKIYNPSITDNKITLNMVVNQGLGDDIPKTYPKELVKETILFASDKEGNFKWRGIRYKIKNQNTKGTVLPNEKETFKDVPLTKEEIIEAVKNGIFTYNTDGPDKVPDQNKTGDNALHREVGGKDLLNPDKVKEFSISDEDYEKLDFSKLSTETEPYQEVPVTITYLDNSKSTVNVKINIKENVPTGLSDSGYFFLILLLGFGLVAGAFGLLNFRKERREYYE